MAVEGPLGVAGGAAGVAQAHGHALVRRPPLEVVGGAVDEVLVVQHVRQPRLDVAGRVHQHVVLDAVDVAGDPLEEGQHRGVDEDHPVPGVVHDVGELSRK